MENKVFEANLAEISEYNKNLALRISSLNSFRQNIEIFQNNNGEYNLCVNGVFLHSKDGAELEAKNIVSKIENLENENSVFILFGLGLGYLLDSFFEQAKGKIILYEPNIEILKTTLEIVELSHILKNIIVVDNFDDLQKNLYNICDKDTKTSVSFLNSYWSVYKNEIVAVAKEIEFMQGTHFAGEKMILEIGHQAIDNVLNNIKYFSDATFLGDLKGILKGKTALIASAGPSLGKNIEKIKKHRDKFVIFSIGASYKTFINNGIQPDFLSMIEVRNTIGQVEGLDVSKVNLILEASTHPDIWKIPARRKILFLSRENFLNDWLARALRLDNSKLKILGTVSYASMLASQYMGAKNIVLIGEDLAYSDAQCYAKGSAYEELQCIFDEEENKYKIIPKDKDKYYLSLLGSKDANNEQRIRDAEGYINTLNRNLYTVLGQNGEMLPTQTAYAMFVRHHEDFASQNFGLFGAQTRLINASTGGAQINGFENIDVEDFANSLENFDNGFELVQKNIDISSLKEKLTELKNILKNGSEDFIELINLARKIALEHKRRKFVNDNIQKMLDKLDEKNKIYREKYNKYDNIVYYVCLAFYLDLMKIVKLQDINIITAGGAEYDRLESTYTHFKNHYSAIIDGAL